MNARELVHHTFSWEIAPGIARVDAQGEEEPLASAPTGAGEDSPAA